MSKKRRLVIANWKMYIKSPDRAKEFARGLRRRSRQFSGVSVAVAPPFTLIPPVAAVLKGSAISLGAQSLSPFGDEKHTGEISAPMLKHAGVLYCLVGHSERRALGESDDIIRIQLHRAAAEGLMPVLCIGEKERDASGSHFTTIERQLTSALGERTAKNTLKRLVVAYEPVWAIGKSAGDAMKPGELQETVIFIRKILADLLGRPAALRTAVLYGGSVEEENADILLSEGGVSGFLVGHASTDLDSFLPILKACSR